jgi:hypothetical protein
LSAFNHVVAGVRIYGKYLLMDATAIAVPYNLLPVRDLNGKGLVADLSATQWTALDPDQSKTYYATTSWKWDEKGNQQVTGEVQFNNYAGIAIRKRLLQEETPSLAMDELFTSQAYSNYADSLTIEHLKETHLPLKIDYSFNRNVATVQDTISVGPLLVSSFKSNPFTSASRTLPVDFVVAVEEANNFSLIIPGGYRLVDAPQPYELQLPGKKGTFTYAVSATAEKLTIKSILEINEPYFSVGEYPELRVFFQKYFAKIGEKIVLIRTE